MIKLFRFFNVGIYRIAISKLIRRSDIVNDTASNNSHKRAPEMALRGEIIFSHDSFCTQIVKIVFFSVVKFRKWEFFYFFFNIYENDVSEAKISLFEVLFAMIQNILSDEKITRIMSHQVDALWSSAHSTIVISNLSQLTCIICSAQISLVLNNSLRNVEKEYSTHKNTISGKFGITTVNCATDPRASFWWVIKRNVYFIIRRSVTPLTKTAVP